LNYLYFSLKDEKAHAPPDALSRAILRLIGSSSSSTGSGFTTGSGSGSGSGSFFVSAAELFQIINQVNTS